MTFDRIGREVDRGKTDVYIVYSVDSYRGEGGCGEQFLSKELDHMFVQRFINPEQKLVYIILSISYISLNQISNLKDEGSEQFKHQFVFQSIRTQNKVICLYNQIIYKNLNIYFLFKKDNFYTIGHSYQYQRTIINNLEQCKMQNGCQQFCGCQQYIETELISTKVYTCFFMVLVVVMLALKTGTQWFIYKDYYPLKQKSPILCIVMIAFITLQIILYPLLYIYNYFTKSFECSQYIYRMFYYGLDGTIYFIYILRSLRLVYAHTTDPSRQKTYIFKLFKYEYILAIIAIALMLLRMVPIYWNPNENQYKFYTMIEFSTPFSYTEEVPFLVKTLIIEAIWMVLLIYCLKIQSLTHPKHSMKNQLILIISVNIILQFAEIILVSQQVGQSSLFFGLCSNFDAYPSVELTKSISLIIMFVYSALFPLRSKKVYHMLLPTGRNYGLTKTMRDFLLEPEFLDIFSKYLEHLDEQNGTTSYSGLLQKWKRVMILKFSEHKSEEQKLREIKELLIEDNIFEVISQESSNRKGSKSLVKSLIKSIESLEEPLNLSQEIMIRYRSEVNEKVEELERKLLQKLDKIYKDSYHETKSYYHLKTKLNFYKKVNVNMILMKMALMVQTDQIL